MTVLSASFPRYGTGGIPIQELDALLAINEALTLLLHGRVAGDVPDVLHQEFTLAARSADL